MAEAIASTIKTLLKLETEAARQQQTVESLKSKGHPCPDAERQLQRLKESIALLEGEPSRKFPKREHIGP